MGSSARAEVVYGIVIGSVEETDLDSDVTTLVSSLRELGVDCVENDNQDPDLDEYAEKLGLGTVAVGSWDYGSRIICASASISAYCHESTTFSSLPDVDPEQKEKLQAIADTLGRPLTWHLVPFYG